VSLLRESGVRGLLLGEDWTPAKGRTRDPAISFDIGKRVRVRLGDGSLSEREKATLVNILVRVPDMVQLLHASVTAGPDPDRKRRIEELLLAIGWRE